MLLSLIPAWLAPPLEAAPAITRPPALLAAQFSSPSLPADWTVDREGVWTVRAGRLHAKLPDKKQEKSFAFFGSKQWKNYVVDLDVRQIRGVDKGIAVRVDDDEGVACGASRARSVHRRIGRV